MSAARQIIVWLRIDCSNANFKREGAYDMYASGLKWHLLAMISCRLSLENCEGGWGGTPSLGPIRGYIITMGGGHSAPLKQHIENPAYN